MAAILVRVTAEHIAAAGPIPPEGGYLPPGHRIVRYFVGEPVEPFDFSIEIEEWLPALLAGAGR